MKNLYLLKNLTIFIFLFSALNLSGQGFIVEQKQPLPDGLMIKSNFEKQDYTNILNENGTSLYIHNSSLNQNSNNENNLPTEDNAINEVTLTIDLVFDPEQYYTPWIIMVYDESGNFYFAPSPPTNLVSFNVPPGVYDILVDFSLVGLTTSHIVIKEMVDVSENTTTQLIASDADNYISINVYDENGQILEPGAQDPETGNPSIVLFNQIVRFLPANITHMYAYNLNAPHEGGESWWNFYINDVSDRYVVTNDFTGIGFGEAYYFTKFETLSGISGSVVLENDPDDWAFHSEQFQPSPLGESGGVYPGFTTQSFFQNKSSLGWTFNNTITPIDPEEAFKAFLNNPINEDPANLFVLPAIVDHIGLADPWWVEEGFFIRGNSVFSDESGNIHYGSGDIGFSPYFLGNRYYFTGNVYGILPFHPKFSFSPENIPNGKPGDGTPIAITMIEAIPDQWNFLHPQYKGRYGETRDADFFATQIEVEHNGNIIFSGNYIEFTWEYGTFGTGLPMDGQIKIFLTNPNITVDGLAGKNLTTLSYNASETDSPPTLQALQFRNALNELTNSFDSASQGTLRLAAGDFQFNPVSYVSDYNEGNTVEFFYSLYDQNNWTELELTEYPEYFQMPAFGDYYEASLESVIVPEENSWFDVKIICTDTAGNKQEQIISPAFKVEQATMGIEEVNQSSFTVYPNPFTNEINIQVPETLKGNYTFKVSDVSGKIIYTESGKSENKFAWNGSSLPKGIYILSIESNGKTIAKKVVKK